MTTMETVKTHYAAPALLNRIEAGLGQLGKDPTTLTPDDLSPVDEFHVRGAAATADLITLLAPGTGAHVLDVGSGLGGPARRLARSAGCRVTGIDLSESFCQAGTQMNAWLGLSEQVTLLPGDATNLPQFADATFDGAWTLHVGMNIANKPACYGEVWRVLKPGGVFVIYDILAAGTQPIHFPVPWAQTQATSFLVTQAELQAAVRAAGFAVTVVEDHTSQALTFLERAAAQQSQQSAPPPLGLHLVLGPIVRTMLQSLRQNFAEQRVALAAIRCEKAN